MKTQVKTSDNTTRFYAHHVGGRAGSVNFPSLPKFDEDITQIIYDADESCLEQVSEIWRGKSAKVFPYCLAESDGERIFNITYDPSGSSLYPFNKHFGNFYLGNYRGYGNTDYLLEHACKTERLVTLKVNSLDKLVDEQIVPPVDFLSIDTQGSELAILRGGRQTLRKYTVAVLCEINFNEVYDGAPLFGELDEYLREQSFLMVDITAFNYLSYKRIPTAFRGACLPLQGEALYLLRPDKIQSSNPQELSARLEKLAFAAITFGYIDFAVAALEILETVIPEKSYPLNTYQIFLKLFSDEIKKDSSMPPLWHELVSFRESNQRFMATPAADSGKFISRVIGHLRHDPKGFPKKVANWGINKLKTKRFVHAFPLRISFRSAPTSFESFLRRYGFHKAAESVYEFRHREI